MRSLDVGRVSVGCQCEMSRVTLRRAAWTLHSSSCMQAVVLQQRTPFVFRSVTARHSTSQHAIPRTARTRAEKVEDYHTLPLEALDSGVALGQGRSTTALAAVADLWTGLRRECTRASSTMLPECCTGALCSFCKEQKENLLKCGRCKRAWWVPLLPARTVLWSSAADNPKKPTLPLS